MRFPRPHSARLKAAVDWLLLAAGALFVSATGCLWTRSPVMRRSARIRGRAWFVAALLLLPLLAARGVEASGAIGGGECADQKDELIGVGSVLYIGTVWHWNWFDTNNNLIWLTESWRNSEAGGFDLLPENSEPPSWDTSVAAGHLRAVGIELGAQALLDERIGWDTEPVMCLNPDTFTWYQCDTDYSPAFESMVVKLGDLRFTDFDPAFAPHPIEFGTGPSSPFGATYNSFASHCAGLNDVCWWLRALGRGPQSVTPATSIALMPPMSVTGAPQYGVTMLVVTDPGYEIAPRGPVDTFTLDPPGYLIVDLVVPDLPMEWINNYGNVVRVASTVDWGTLTCTDELPAMSRRGSALLVLAVLGMGLLAILWPRREWSPQLRARFARR